ncbi:MAG: hypothetical protein D8M59_07550 [Planctomycetes bacterium]|nr:hypothetical protein [Planctomycetota bacterium]
MIFRLSQRLNAKIKAGQLQAAPVDENTFADWSARLFTVDRVQYILLSNTVSLYSVVMHGRGVTSESLFISRAFESIREFMTADDMGFLYTNCIASSTDSVRFAKAFDRRVTGSMNELEATARLYQEAGELTPFDVGFKLNETLLSAIGTLETHGYATPREAFMRLRTSTQ